MRTTKIVAPLVAMALCTPNIAFAQENQTTISGSTDIDGNYSLTRSISAINRDNSGNKNNPKPQERNTIYVNPGDTIHVKLDLKEKEDKGNHGFTDFTEVVSPIQEFTASSGTLTVKRNRSSEPHMDALNNLPSNQTFMKTSESTLKFDSHSPTHYGDLGHQVTIEYSYKAGNKPGYYVTEFQPHGDFSMGLSTFDAKKLKLTVVVNDKKQATPPEQGNQPKPPAQGEQPTPPESNGGGFGWLTGALGVLALLGGAVWFVIKHVLRL
ncbi:membrane protein [Corynebacterium diphtheriae]|nr:membrane protein [Corynebacterium diphtheriae]CAB0713164.1 membrane protein [Corynebacterium diphtheriae]CAB0713647.1 membrane protein [Corynebacterium diphtheriae]CAB1009618.1 membrane protein [Corynebacterium diphtheriae]